MKISEKQAKLLARQIVAQLKQKKAHKVPDEVREQIKEFLKKRTAYLRAEKDAEETRRKFDRTLYDIVGRVNGVEPYQSLDNIIGRLEEKNIPSTTDIEDEIILKSMFKSEEDMTTFMNSIIKKYEKKLQNKIVVN